MHGSGIPVWFFIGVLLLVYGVMILGYGLYELATGSYVDVRVTGSFPNSLMGELVPTGRELAGVDGMRS